MIDLARVFPEFVFELKDMPDVVLDGELVMLGEKGHPAFERLFRRAAMRRPQMIGQATATEPAAIFAFDLLSLRGQDLREIPLIERKRLLREVLRRPPKRIETWSGLADCRNFSLDSFRESRRIWRPIFDTGQGDIVQPAAARTLFHGQWPGPC